MNAHRQVDRLQAVRLRVATAVACLVVAVAALHAQPSQKDEQLVLAAMSGETSYEYRVSRRRLALTKPWSPDTQPPLSVPAAVAVAKKAARLPEPADFVLTAVQLRPYGLDNSGDWRWFYDVEFFNARDAFDKQPPKRQHIVILMDGTVVEPTATSGRP